MQVYTRSVPSDTYPRISFTFLIILYLAKFASAVSLWYQDERKGQGADLGKFESPKP